MEMNITERTVCLKSNELNHPHSLVDYKLEKERMPNNGDLYIL